MSESSSQDKNLPASQRKLDKARADGDVVRSRDLGHFAALAGGGAALVAAMPTLTDWTRQLLVEAMRFNRASVANPGFMVERLSELVAKLMWVVVPVGSLMMALGIGASLAIGGWSWTFKPLTPTFSGFNPITGIGRLFSKKQLIDALKASFLALLLIVIGGMYLKSHIDAFSTVMGMQLPAGLHQVGQVILNGLWLLVLVLALFAAVDAPLQKYLHAQRLRMSSQELKQEQKEQNGNPEIKARVRALMRQASRRRMMAAVPTADLVVMNPTHYAVALKYDEAQMAAPRVVAKGADLIAIAIRDLAKTSKVPVLQSPVLARALYTHAAIDREIPAALFAAVAQVLAYVYQLRAAMSGKQPMPPDLPELDVPAELDPHNVPAGAEALAAGDRAAE